jgi:hypothetical protein
MQEPLVRRFNFYRLELTLGSSFHE